MLILLWFSMFTHRSILSIIRYSNWLACGAVIFPTKTKTVVVGGISLIRVFWEFNEIHVISPEISQVVGRNRENVNEVGKGVGKTVGTGHVNHRNGCFSQLPFFLMSKTRTWAHPPISQLQWLHPVLWISSPALPLALSNSTLLSLI